MSVLGRVLLPTSAVGVGVALMCPSCCAVRATGVIVADMNRAIALSFAVALAAVTLGGCTTSAPTSRPAAQRHLAVTAAGTSTPCVRSIRIFDGLTSALGGLGHVVITGGIGDYGTTGHQRSQESPTRAATTSSSHCVTVRS